MKLKDLTNCKFGKLKVIKYTGNSYWLCECACGKTKKIRADHLLKKEIISCGCYNREKTSRVNSIHCMTNTKIYNVWSNMKRRCQNKKSEKFKIYGERGIKVWDEWKNDFLTFYKWSIENGYKEGLTIDRIDTNGNYEPSNCRWVDMKTQQNNRRNNHLVTYKNETHTIAEWAEIKKINYHTLLDRINRYQWSTEKAFTYNLRRLNND